MTRARRGDGWNRKRDRDPVTGEPLLRAGEVAAILRVTPRHVTRMVEKGRLRAALSTARGYRYRIGDVIDMACREADE